MRYPHIDPVLIHIGPLQVRWYGLMYVFGFLAAYFLVRHQEKTRPIGLSPALLQDLIFYLVVGLVIGARLGYILFYQYMNLTDYIDHHLEIIAVWHGGVSFHGGLIGAVVAGWLFYMKRKLPFRAIADRVIIAVPIGLGDPANQGGRWTTSVVALFCVLGVKHSSLPACLRQQRH